MSDNTEVNWEKEARQLLWLNHGPNCRPYGDDGEMQCCGLDFKRANWHELKDRVLEMRLRRLKAEIG